MFPDFFTFVPQTWHGQLQELSLWNLSAGTTGDPSLELQCSYSKLQREGLPSLVTFLHVFPHLFNLIPQTSHSQLQERSLWNLSAGNTGEPSLKLHYRNSTSCILTCSRKDVFFCFVFFSTRQTWILWVFAHNNWNPKAGIDQSTVKGRTNWLFFF